MNLPVNIYFVRHGQSEANVAEVACGHTDSPLTPTGVDQASETAKALSHVRFDSAYASDLARAYETGKIILAARDMDIARTPLLRELTYGRFEGTSYGDFSAIRRKALAAAAENNVSQWDLRYGEGCETSAEAAGRIERFLQMAHREHGGETILAATHGGLMRVLLIHAGWGTFETLPNGCVRNTAYIQASYHRNGEIEIGSVHGVELAGVLVSSQNLGRTA